ncbi:MAG TPA: GFA family protein [Burkholderiales bacterium]|nr:GFA family protein [Burkholderiales bacterium]
MKVRGSCHCGRIGYEAEVDPASTNVCNCTDCQMLTGSAFRVSVHAPAASFRLSGQPRVYVKTADSGTRRRHAFCAECGTPVYSCADSDEPAAYSLRVGCLDRRAELRPAKRNWCRSALPWSQDISAVPAFD